MTAGVEIDAVTRRFGQVTALDRVSLRIEPGEFAVLLGPSGCGKTTLLNILGGFLDADGGAVRIGGRDVTAQAPQRRPTATVFQDYALFPHMTLAQNVGFGLRMGGMGRRARRARAEEMLELVGLAGQGSQRPASLSGGQRQRVALARAFAVGPELLLLDEPLGALDLKLRRAMQDELTRIQREVGTTFVHVTHDQEEAMAIADRLVVMNAGRIEDEGPPERVYRRPATRFAAEFMGEINLLPATGRAGVLETPLGPMPLATGLGEGAPVLLGLRPEAFAAGTLDLGPAVVEDTAFVGTHRRAHLRPDAAPDLRLVVHLPVGPAPAPGARIPLRADPDAAVILPV